MSGSTDVVFHGRKASNNGFSFQQLQVYLIFDYCSFTVSFPTTGYKFIVCPWVCYDESAIEAHLKI